ncbi:cytochrome b-c1 complex subunit 9-like [Phascolarctos cinereus]|uniref:Complex III subunit 9 n=1 Tax=Phascolarctos cinereus TaxID=38626 RepID=A0A6P5JDY4_PHACI|nr:cytochrome b-c1 complex subunit 9-like [Phascolarctos cinereus]
MVSPSMLRQVYSIFFRRTSTFVLTSAVGVLFFERAFDQGGDAIYESINQGKLWKPIKHKYEEE